MVRRLGAGLSVECEAQSLATGFDVPGGLVLALTGDGVVALGTAIADLVFNALETVHSRTSAFSRRVSLTRTRPSWTSVTVSRAPH